MLEVEVTPRAAAQTERAAAWWAENRLAAPDAIRIDFHTSIVEERGIGCHTTVYMPKTYAKISDRAAQEAAEAAGAV